jgi:hypothetical protein
LIIETYLKRVKTNKLIIQKIYSILTIRFAKMISRSLKLLGEELLERSSWFRKKIIIKFLL